MQSIEIVGLDQRIAQILKKNGCESRASVLGELIEIELDTLNENSTLLFNRARVRYEEQLSQLKIKDAVKIEQKKRRKAELVASDIIDMYMYVISIREDFPRRVLKDVSLYRDITLMEQQENADDIPEEEGSHTPGKRVTFGGVKSPRSATDATASASVEQGQISSEDVDRTVETSPQEHVNSLRDESVDISQVSHNTSGDCGEVEFECAHAKCKHLKAQFDNLWAEMKKCHDYMLNIEKVSNERISQLEYSRQLENVAKKTHAITMNTSKQPQPRAHNEKSQASSQLDQRKAEKEPHKNAAKEHNKNEDHKKVEPKGKSNSRHLNRDHVSMSDDADGASGSNVSTQPKKKSTQVPAGAASSQNKSSSGSIESKKSSGAVELNKFPNKSTKTKRTLTASSQHQHRSRTVELYLPNISRHDDDTLGDVAERVREHGKRGGLNIISSRIVRNRFTDSTVGCRITVPERQQDDALGNRVWPSGMKCRRWEKREKSEEYQRSHSRQRRQHNQNQGSHMNWRENEVDNRDDGRYRERDDSGRHDEEAYENFYDSDGYDRDGYDGEGYDEYGYNRDGYDRNGYDLWDGERQGYDRDGYPDEEYESWEDRYVEGDSEERPN